MQPFVAGLAADTVDTSATVEHPGNGRDEESRQYARPAGPQGDPQRGARQQATDDLRHAQLQGHSAQHKRQCQGARTPRRRRPHPCPSRDTREQTRGQKRTPLAYSEAPTNAQDLAAVGITQGMMREAVIQMCPPSEPIDPERQGRRDARSRHKTLGASLTAVP
jgi:hypothetical protein